MLEDTPYYPQQTYQCGPASLAMLLSASGATIYPEALVSQTYLPGRQGSLQLELLAACRQYNRIPYVIDPDVFSLIAELRAGRPVLVLLNLGLNILPAYHYAVVIGVLPPNNIVLRSGGDQRLVMDMDHFLVKWNRASSWGMIVLIPGELPVDPDPVHYLSAVSAAELRGNFLLAMKGYKAARVAWPKDQTVMLALGNNYLSQDKYYEAEAIFSELITNNPDHIAASNNLAETLARQECYLQALFAVNRAVRVAERLNSPLKETVLQTRKEITQHLLQTDPALDEMCNDHPVMPMR